MTASPSLPTDVDAFAVTAPPTLQHRLQYGGLRVVVALLRAAGWRTASGFGGWLGRFAYRPVGIRRAIVTAHLQQAFPTWSAEQINATARMAYDSLGRTSIETAVLAGTSARSVQALVPEVEGWEHLETALALGKGVILATGHLGNWELGGAYIASRGVPVAAITRKMQNPLFDSYLRATRASMQVEVIHDAVAIRRVPRALSEGKMIAFLCDQDAIGLASTFVLFFGKPARTPRGPGVFALRFGTPVIFGACLRRDDGRYRMILDSVPLTVTGDRNHDIDTMVASFTKRLEDEIRRTPAQYFWHHRRWKRQPPATEDNSIVPDPAAPHETDDYRRAL